MTTRWIYVLLAALALTGCDFTKKKDAKPEAPEIAAVEVDGDYLVTGGNGSNWAAVGYNYSEQRFSPLTRINANNVGRLGLAWYADLPDARGQEATPLVVDGKLFVSTAWSKVLAYDVLTGEKLWSFDPKVPKTVAVKACCDVVNRGVAMWRGKLFVGTLDGRLIALDSITGAQLWSVQTTDPDKPYTITGAPRVAKNKVIIGNGGAEFGVRGYVSAYDVNDGALRWRFYTVPSPDGEPDDAASDSVLATAARTWSEGGEWNESGGGGTVWDSIVYDPDLDQLYIGVGNGNPWNHGLRSNGEGDNLFLSSIVALNPDTGEYLWHYQETPGETWDYTATQSIILADLRIPDRAPLDEKSEAAEPKAKAKGKESAAEAPAPKTRLRKVILHAPKNGFFFVIDRTDGSLISAEPFVDNINWASGYDMETGRPIENPEARFYKTGEPFVAIPGALGAHNWHPMSYNPRTRLAYIPAQQVPQAYAALATKLDTRKTMGFNLGIATGKGPPTADDGGDGEAAYRAAIAATTGRLVAFDPVAGKVRWSVDYPAAWNGGTLTTAGNLVFQGTSLGRFRAYAADTGQQLLDLNVQSGVVAAPSTFMAGGEQYVAFLTSKGGVFPLVAGVAGGESRKVPNIPRLIVLKLGGKKGLPRLPKAEAVAWNPPEIIGTKKEVATGQALFERYCTVCHGGDAIGNGFTPDLRISGALAERDAWRSIVIGGALAERGMASFEPVLSPAGAENIRKYVIERSNWTKKNAAETSAPSRARR